MLYEIAPTEQLTDARPHQIAHRCTYASFGNFGSNSPISAYLLLYGVCFAQHLANKGMCNNK